MIESDRPSLRPLAAWDGEPADGESLLEPGALRAGFSLARREQRRPSRWLLDLVGPPGDGRGDDLERRAAELDARERELVRREEAAARWFSELTRIQRLLEQERGALDARRA